MRQGLTQETGAQFAGIALGHVTREHPHKLRHVLTSTEGARTPSAFYGCSADARQL